MKSGSIVQEICQGIFCLKIINNRYLRRDKPENLSYSRKLGFMRVVESKLIPLAKWYILIYF